MEGCEYVGVRQFAAGLGVSEVSVRRWIFAGRIRAYKTPGGMVYRIPLSELERWNSLAVGT